MVLLCPQQCEFGNRFYSHECPTVRFNNRTDLWVSEMLRGQYKRTCPYFDTCARSAVGSSCNASQTSLDGEKEDHTFTFAGMVGKVTYVPPDEADDGSTQYRVSFNDGRTDYGFDLADLELETPE